MSLPKFESYLTPDGDVLVRNLDLRTEMSLSSAEGYAFGEDLIKEFGTRYPSAIRAIEQRIAQREPQTWKAMRTNRRLYVQRVAWTICACCFGELDGQPDWDGKCFHPEEPRGCRERHHCPYCGYSERNEQMQSCICGMRREYRLTEQEKRIVRLVQHGACRPEVIADVMQTTLDAVRGSLKNIYHKVGVAGMPELVFAIKDERV